MISRAWLKLLSLISIACCGPEGEDGCVPLVDVIRTRLPDGTFTARVHKEPQIQMERRGRGGFCFFCFVQLSGALSFALPLSLPLQALDCHRALLPPPFSSRGCRNEHKSLGTGKNLFRKNGSTLHKKIQITLPASSRSHFKHPAQGSHGHKQALPQAALEEPLLQPPLCPGLARTAEGKINF